MTKSHVLKTDPQVFEAVHAGIKTHEIRFNDRGFAVGDKLELHETKYSGAEMRAGAPLVYTHRATVRTISHIQTGYGLVDGWCILSFAPRGVACLRCEGRGKHAAFERFSLIDVTCRKCAGTGRDQSVSDPAAPEPCNQAVFEDGSVVAIMDGGQLVMEGLVAEANRREKGMDWHYFGGRAVVKTLGEVDRARHALERSLPVFLDRAAGNMREPVMPAWMDYDPIADVLTIHGIKYHVELFRDFGSAMPVGQEFVLRHREHGALRIDKLNPTIAPGD